MTRAELAAKIDSTLLRASATEEEIAQLCHEAAHFRFAAVCINPTWVSFCAKRLVGTPVAVNACVGFPLGANTAQTKVAEAREAVRNGATEIDMVINIGALKSNYPSYVEREIAAVVKAAKPAPVKVILETGYLSDEEKTAVCEMALRTRAAYVKTSTGYGDSGATTADVTLMRRIVGDALGVKAAGGVRTYADVLAMLDAGASRIGTSSAIDILAELPDDMA